MTSTDRQPAAGRRGRTFAAGFASVAGWSFDLFDLFLVLYVSGPVSHLIFPSSQPTLSLAAVFASFAVSVLLRPLGAGIFGHYADQRGRKKTLVIVMTGVGVTTALMGLVPTYASAGLLAPVLFLLLRVVQGVFVGGVVAATHTLGTESVAPKWRGLMSGLVGGGGSAIGAALASLVYLAVSSAFPGAEFNVWGWRFMFFSGLLSAVLSYLVFLTVDESEEWKANAGAKKPHISMRALVTGPERSRFALNLALTTGAGGLYYLTAGYLPTFLEQINHLDGTVKGNVLLAANGVALVVAPLAGMASQRFGRRRTMITVGVANLVATPLLLWHMSSLGSADVGAILLSVTLLGLVTGGGHAPVIAYLNERYPTALRARGTAVCWNLGFMVGGLLPTFVSLASPALSDIPSRLVMFIVAVVLVYLIANILSPETRSTDERLAPQLDARVEQELTAEERV